MALVFERVVTEGLGDLSYLIGDDSRGIAAVIDPRADVEVYLQLARRHQVAITHILQTHVHEDFLSGALELAARVGNAKVCSSAVDAAPYGYPHEPLRDGDRLEFGATVLTARHTPGHTPEHMAFLVAESGKEQSPYAVFSGGSLLINAAGRTDLLGPERARELTATQYRTLHDFFLRLDDGVIVHPTHAHGSPCGASIGDRLASTVGYERRFNPYLQCRDEAAFSRLALGQLPPKPSYYPRLKESNTQGPPVLGGLPVVPPLPPQAFQARLRQGDAIVLDTRHMLAFGGGHIEGALNIGGSAQLPIWAGWMLDAGQPLLLVLESDGALGEVVALLLRTGFTRFAGYLVGGMGRWDNAGFGLATTKQVTAAQIHDRPGAFTLLDVRAPSEWEAGRLPGARHVYLPELPARAGELPHGKPVVVYCDTGYRASIGASVLQRAGLADVATMPGSMQAWKRAGYPLEEAPA
ncbi:MBL fold metallo-hydrolase [Ramlibacter sp.]|uniref:MBL fold metallo-hydrolase n=1 Tax=Ramlibacter sp. TaxID=1917967 RepID=UPI002C6F5637|nr:MBL fold metallo-hydrolase [Ramlibacter sp.]HWI84446.1 MBL fold metallo-hydrolase [Ramlibacter sp.]